MEDLQQTEPYRDDDVVEADLMVRLVERDPEALAAIYDRYGSSVHSLFRRVVRDNSAAEDLVQELFFRLWNRAYLYDPSRGLLAAWIFSLARNMAVDHARSPQGQWTSRRTRVDVEQWLPPQHCRQAESLIHRVIAVKTAFRALNANERCVLELTYIGYSQSEIAARLQRPVGTVKSWMRSAFARLRAYELEAIQPLRRANAVLSPLVAAAKVRPLRRSGV